jgi:hypothetical protein
MIVGTRTGTVRQLLKHLDYALTLDGSPELGAAHFTRDHLSVFPQHDLRPRVTMFPRAVFPSVLSMNTIQVVEQGADEIDSLHRTGGFNWRKIPIGQKARAFLKVGSSVREWAS